MDIKKRRNPKAPAYNWPLIKGEYFKSDMIDVKGFLYDKFGTYNSNFRRQTAGWRAEKEKFLEEQVEANLAEFKKKRSKVVAENLETMLYVITREAKRLAKEGKIDSKDAKRYWEMVRTENGLPTRITKMDLEGGIIPFDKAREEFDNKIKNESTGKVNATDGSSNEGEERPDVEEKLEP